MSGARSAAEVGTCRACGQELILTATDCWHPYTVERACPPEPEDSSSRAYSEWLQAGNRPGRPGRENFIPVDPPESV